MPYTEQQIRGLALNFLRFHYKLRPRYIMGGATRIVDKPHYYQGVLIDARLAYQKPDQHYFTATVEATSVDRRDEILYQVNYWRVAIHACVLALLLTGILIWAGTQVDSLHLWKRFGTPQAWGLLLGLFLVTAVLLGLSLSQWRGYRYIYAVNQFKHFYADAQWVAYDVEIFAKDTHRLRRRYRELERQCVKYGFGMLAIEQEQVVRNVMSPSRVDQFRGRRIRLPGWLARAAGGSEPGTQTSTALRSTVALRSWRPGRWLLLLRARARRVYRGLFPTTLRRRPGYYELGGWVLVVGLLGLGLVVFGTVRQASYSPVALEGRRGAEPDLTDLESTVNPAPPLEIEEGEFRPTVDSLPATTPPTNIPGEALVGGEKIEDLADLRRYRIGADGGVRIDYECVQLYALSEPVFVLLFGRYDSFGAAREWAEELQRLYRTPATVAVADCVEVLGTGYLVYLGAPLTGEGEANLSARGFFREGLAVEVLVVGE